MGYKQIPYAGCLPVIPCEDWWIPIPKTAHEVEFPDLS